MEIYYQDQQNWKNADYYSLNRYLNKLFLQMNKRIDEIKSMDITKMSTITKTLLFLVIKFQSKELLLELPNLKPLIKTTPLRERLNLVDNPTNCHEIYDMYNVGL